MSGSIYHLFNPGQTIPLNGILRLREHFSVYDEDDKTSESFVLPHDHSTVALRTGLRWGGKEPVIHPDLAMELSAWYEGQFRTDSGSYGDNGDRVLEPFSQLMFARALLIYTLPESKQNLSLSLTGGDSGHADRFSAYRLGGNLPLSSEFPLLIPGYFYEELSARALSPSAASIPCPGCAKHWTLTTYGAVGGLDYLPALSQPGHINSGVGIGVAYAPGSWQVQTSYGYGLRRFATAAGARRTSASCCSSTWEPMSGRIPSSTRTAPTSPAACSISCKGCFNYPIIASSLAASAVISGCPRTAFRWPWRFGCIQREFLLVSVKTGR